jgi:hypothetical protein
MMFCTGFLLSVVLSQPTPREACVFLDDLFRSSSSEAVMEMTIVTPDWERTLSLQAWSLGTDHSFIRVLAPPREAGMATLRVGNDIWNYMPNTGSTVRVPPSMMSGSWMGSDITNNDMVQEITYAEDYSASWGDPPDGNSLLLVLVPLQGTPVVWSRIEILLDLETLLPEREEYFDGRGNITRTILFTEPREMGGRKIPTVMTVIPARDGRRTVMRWTSVIFDADVDPGVFSMRNLQSGDW